MKRYNYDRRAFCTHDEPNGKFVLFEDSQRELAKVEKLNSSLITNAVLHVKEKKAIQNKLASALRRAEKAEEAVEFWKDQCTSFKVQLQGCLKEKQRGAEWGNEY